MISLCEKCKLNNWRHMQEIIEAYKDAGIKRPSHIWCDAKDRPENIKFEKCSNFMSHERRNTNSKAAISKRKPRFVNNPTHLSGVRKIKRRKAYTR